METYLDKRINNSDTIEKKKSISRSFEDGRRYINFLYFSQLDFIRGEYTPIKITYTADPESKPLYLQDYRNDIQRELDMNLNISKLDAFCDLKENWDSEGGLPFSKSLINKVRTTIYNLGEQPKVFPTGRGSIQLEYRKPNGRYLEFEIFDDRIIMLKVENRENIIEKDIHYEEIFSNLNDFIRHGSQL